MTLRRAGHVKRRLCTFVLLDLYTVIGNARTRKSTLVRCLSGCFNRSVRDIQPATGRAAFRLYARAGSLQETRTRPLDFAEEAERQRCEAVLCCLSPAAHPLHREDFPDAAAYLRLFEARGWRVRAIAVLGQNAGGVRSPQLMQYPNAMSLPINLTAQGVRQQFGWL
jgi:hypothetical protein